MTSSRPFIHDDFLLHTPTARKLYHEYAAGMPIIDYHCHLSPAEVAADRRWENLAQLWLAGDHYKWRAMRTNGIDEECITGSATDRDKFRAFAATMPYLLRNPLFDWAQLELARYFGITTILSPDTADAIWEQSAGMLAKPGFSARGFMERSNVKVVCTTDDPTDTLEHHAAVRESGFSVRMLPAWRPDKALLIDRPEFWNGWLDKLAAAAGVSVDSYDDLLQALERRHAFFHAAGCRLSDYGVETVPAAAPCTPGQLAAIFDKARAGGKVTPGRRPSSASSCWWPAARWMPPPDGPGRFTTGPCATSARASSNCSGRMRAATPSVTHPSATASLSCWTGSIVRTPCRRRSYIP